MLTSPSAQWIPSQCTWVKPNICVEVRTRLFISFVKPHKAVTSSSITRWLRTVLEEAGIDSSIFGAHSTCGASTSAAARGGVTLEDILKAANWSSESVFQRFYHKEVDRVAFGRAIINQNSLEEVTNNTVDVWDWAFWNIIVRMAKTTSVVASYSRLYEEGEVDHINCPHPPSRSRRS